MSNEMEQEQYDSLQDLTGQESGAVVWDDDSIWIGNWSSIDGLPRVLGMFDIGLGEPLFAEPIDVPGLAVRAMQEHEREQGADVVSTDGYTAWRVNGEATVVVQDDWA